MIEFVVLTVAWAAVLVGVALAPIPVRLALAVPVSVAVAWVSAPAGSVLVFAVTSVGAGTYWRWTRERTPEAVAA